jgi:uncharacterized membrane protein YhaH (DUF805 family)
MMSMDDTNRSFSGSHRRERATRGAFYLWMAAYAAIVVAIVAVHAIGGASAPDGEPTRQATRSGVSLGPVVPVVAQADVNG